MMHHNFFYGVLRERDGVRERCFLWRRVYGTPSQRRSRRLTATAFRSSDSKLNSNSFWSSRSISSASCDARSGRSRHRVLPAQEQSARVGQRCRRRPCALSDETDTTGQLYSSTAFFSCPTIISRCLQRPAPHVEGVVQARKKSVGSWFVAESAPLGGEL